MPTDKEIYDLSDRYGVPRKYVGCPGCGREYGAYNRKVCVLCEECSKCCKCYKSDLIDAEEFVVIYVIPHI